MDQDSPSPREEGIEAGHIEAQNAPAAEGSSLRACIPSTNLQLRLAEQVGCSGLRAAPCHLWRCGAFCRFTTFKARSKLSCTYRELRPPPPPFPPQLLAFATQQALLLPLDTTADAPTSSVLTITSELQAFTQRLVNLQHRHKKQPSPSKGSGVHSDGNMISAGRGADSHPSRLPHPAAAAADCEPTPSPTDYSLHSTPLPTIFTTTTDAAAPSIFAATTDAAAPAAAAPSQAHEGSPLTPRPPSQAQQQQQQQHSGVIPATPDPATAGPSSSLPPRPPSRLTAAPGAAGIAVSRERRRSGGGRLCGSGKPSSSAAAAAAVDSVAATPLSAIAAATPLAAGSADQAAQGHTTLPASIAAELAALREHQLWSNQELAALRASLAAAQADAAAARTAANRLQAALDQERSKVVQITSGLEEVLRKQQTDAFACWQEQRVELERAAAAATGADAGWVAGGGRGEGQRPAEEVPRGLERSALQPMQAPQHHHHQQQQAKWGNQRRQAGRPNAQPPQPSAPASSAGCRHGAA